MNGLTNIFHKENVKKYFNYYYIVIFYTFEHLKRRLISVKNQLRFEVLPSVKTTDGRTFSYMNR